MARAIAGEVCTQVRELIDVLEDSDEELSELAKALLASAKNTHDRIVEAE